MFLIQQAFIEGRRVESGLIFDIWKAVAAVMATAYD
jgi:hypothetical protein